MDAERDSGAADVLTLTDLLSAAGQQLEAATTARREALDKIAGLARDARDVLTVERIAQLGAVAPTTVRTMLAVDGS
ncbi:hypothetical protein [Nocardioides xinjiangensis]|uniref:hypothetical protein n=1 Tax=Nocardioides xinjiangensis TaxID=2817376 RepID=UPI001B311EC9|nr:hypothetical protein [Nocardioides sp. SYSU D00778]